MNKVIISTTLSTRFCNYVLTCVDAKHIIVFLHNNFVFDKQDLIRPELFRQFIIQDLVLYRKKSWSPRRPFRAHKRNYSKIISGTWCGVAGEI